MADMENLEMDGADLATTGDSHLAGRIVVGMDGSPGARRALDWAGAEAERTGGELMVVGAWTYGGFGGNVISEEDARFIVEAAATSAVDRHPTVSVKHRFRKDPAAHALIDESRGADLLVVGSRGFGGFRGLLFGSVGQHCLTHAACSVAIIRSPDEPLPDESGSDPHHIVVGVDGSDESNLALDWAAAEALRSGAQLDVMGSWIFPGTAGYVFAAPIGVSDAAKEVVLGALDHVAQLAPQVVTRGETSEDPPAVALVEASRSADLLVVGSRGLGAFRGLLLGSVSHHLATHAHCSVLVVRGR
jgi:nucleotide-binding universal stress UspA family protein